MEIDVPGKCASGQDAVLLVGGVAAEGDDLTGLEQSTIGGCRQRGHRRVPDHER